LPFTASRQARNHEMPLIDGMIKRIIGTYFDDLYPTTPQEKELKERVVEAQSHITQAGKIISDLQVELTNQSEQLDKLIEEITQKRVSRIITQTLQKPVKRILSL
jgi:hypothetical protein